MSTTIAPSTRRALILALAWYLLWVLVTYLLEGRIHTCQRPEDMGARLVYTLVANILIGIGGSALVIRFLSRAGTISTQQAGFRGLRHAAVAVVVGGRLASSSTPHRVPRRSIRWSSSTPTRRCWWCR